MLNKNTSSHEQEGNASLQRQSTTSLNLFRASSGVLKSSPSEHFVSPAWFLNTSNSFLLIEMSIHILLF